MVSVVKYIWALFYSGKLLTLVSNMKIQSFNLTIYNSCNWADSSTLIYPDVIMLSTYLTCLSAVRLNSCISPTCCSLGATDRFKLSTYDVTDLRSPEGPTEGNKGEHNVGLLLDDILGSLNGIELDTNIGNEIGLYNGKVIGITLGDLVGM